MKVFLSSVFVFVMYIIFILQCFTINVVFAQQNLCSNVMKNCKEGNNKAVDEALDIISSFNKICLNKRQLVDHIFCLLSPQRWKKHKAFLATTKLAQPRACVLKITDKYYEYEKQAYEHVKTDSRVKCILENYVQTKQFKKSSSSFQKSINIPDDTTSKPAMREEEEEGAKARESLRTVAKKCPISSKNNINSVIKFIRRNKPAALKKKSIVDYMFCMISPRHAVKQRDRFLKSKTEDTLPKLCNLALKSKSNAYSEWDNQLYDSIRSDLRVQCMLYKNGHIKVDDASKFNVNFKFDCTDLKSNHACKLDGKDYGCYWLTDLDMHSPKVKLPTGPQVYKKVLLPDLIKEKWAQRAIDFKVHQKRLRMENAGFSRPGICSCLDPTSESCLFE